MSQPESSKGRTPHVPTASQGVKDLRFRQGIHKNPSGKPATRKGSGNLLVISVEAGSMRPEALSSPLEEHMNLTMLPLKVARPLQITKAYHAVLDRIRAYSAYPDPATATPTLLKGDAARYGSKGIGLTAGIRGIKIERSLAPRETRKSARKAQVIDDIIRNVGTSETFTFEATYQRMAAEADNVRAVLNEVKAQKAAAKAAAGQR